MTCSAALFPASLAKLARMAGRNAAIAMYRAMQATVDEVGRVAAAEGIDCHWAKGGTVQLARSATQLERAAGEVQRGAREFGFGEPDVRLLGRGLAGEGIRGGTWCPRRDLHPALRGHPPRASWPGAWPRWCGTRGVRVFERTPVTEIAPRALRTTHGTVRAEYVIRATEGYTPALPGAAARDRAAVYSLMIPPPEPLADSGWEQIGLAGRPTFSDGRAHDHLRAAHDWRTGGLAFGGRGAPYHLGSAVRPSARPGSPAKRRSATWKQTLGELFPAVADGARSRTGGAARWASPATGAPPPDASTGPAGSAGRAGTSATGCASTTNLGLSRTLAGPSSTLEADSDLTRLPWVNHRSRQWEAEIRCAGWASTPGCTRWPAGPTGGPKPAPGCPSRERRPWRAASWAGDHGPSWPSAFGYRHRCGCCYHHWSCQRR